MTQTQTADRLETRQLVTFRVVPCTGKTSEKRTRPRPPANLLMWAVKLEWHEYIPEKMPLGQIDKWEPHCIGYWRYAVVMSVDASGHQSLAWYSYIPEVFKRYWF